MINDTDRDVCAFSPTIPNLTPSPTAIAVMARANMIHNTLLNKEKGNDLE